MRARPNNQRPRETDMLLTNRRHRLLHLAVAGMEVGWIAPWALLVDSLLATPAGCHAPGGKRGAGDGRGAGQHPVHAARRLLSLALALMVFYMLAADMLNQRQIDSPLRELIMLALVVGTSLVVVRTLIYPTVSATDWEWLANVTGVALQLHRRTTTRSDRAGHQRLSLVPSRLQHRPRPDLLRRGAELPPRPADLRRRRGAACPASTASRLRHRLLFFALFLIFGLTAVAIARIDEKAYLVDSSRGIHTVLCTRGPDRVRCSA